MASLPSDRTKLALAQSNQNPGIAAGSIQNKNALTEIYDTADLLNQKVDGLVGSSTLSPYPPAQYNKLINGGFAVNQRVVSGTVTLTAGQYGHDRWKAGAAGCTYTFATVNNVTTITITAGSLVQVIEGISLYSGTHTLSWSGTAQGKIGAGSFGVSGITGAATGGTNLSIEFNIGTLSNVQFNFGSISLPFQPRSYDDELRLCKRYCRLFTSVGAFNGYTKFGVGQCLSATQASILLTFEEMRVVPSFVFAAAGIFLLFNAAGAGQTVTSISTYACSKASAEIVANVASGLVAGNSTFLVANGNNTAYILLDAEL